MVRIANIWKRCLAIRLHRISCANRPFYQIGVIPNMKRVGRVPDEVFGSYDPMPNEHNEKLVAIDLDRLAYWLGKGAIPSIGVMKLLGFIGFFPMHPSVYKEAWAARLKNIGEFEASETVDDDNKDKRDKDLSM